MEESSRGGSMRITSVKNEGSGGRGGSSSNENNISSSDG